MRKILTPAKPPPPLSTRGRGRGVWGEAGTVPPWALSLLLACPLEEGAEEGATHGSGAVGREVLRREALAVLHHALHPEPCVATAEGEPKSLHRVPPCGCLWRDGHARSTHAHTVDTLVNVCPSISVPHVSSAKILPDFHLPYFGYLRQVGLFNSMAGIMTVSAPFGPPYFGF